MYTWLTKKQLEMLEYYKNLPIPLTEEQEYAKEYEYNQECLKRREESKKLSNEQCKALPKRVWFNHISIKAKPSEFFGSWWVLESEVTEEMIEKEEELINY